MLRTWQEVRDYQKRFFSKPDAVLAKDAAGGCHYLSSEGDKCAIGCLLTDDQYHEMSFHLFEGSAFDESMYKLLVENGILAYDDTGEIYSWLQVTQSIHDNDSDDAADFVNRIIDQSRRDIRRREGC